MTPERIAELRKLLAAEGIALPWLFNAGRCQVDTGQLGGDGVVYDGVSWSPYRIYVKEPDDAAADDAQGRLIAAAINALPELLATAERVERLEAERDKAKKALTDLYKLHDLLACVRDGEAWDMAVAYTAELSRQHDADCDVMAARRERDAAIARAEAAEAEVAKLWALGNAMTAVANHEQKRGFTADCEPACRVCAWCKAVPP